MNNTSNSEIYSLAVFALPRVTQGGTQILASFNLSHAGLIINGCALTRQTDGSLRIYMPAGNTVKIKCPATGKALTDLALRAYRAAGASIPAQEGLPPAITAMLDQQIGGRND